MVTPKKVGIAWSKAALKVLDHGLDILICNSVTDSSV